MNAYVYIYSKRQRGTQLRYRMYVPMYYRLRNQDFLRTRHFSLVTKIDASVMSRSYIVVKRPTQSKVHISADIARRVGYLRKDRG